MRMVRVLTAVVVVVIVIVIVRMVVAVLVLVAFGMFVMAAIFRIAFRQIMVMKMEEALQEKHREKTTQHPFHRAVQRLQMFVGIGQKMQERKAEHQAGDEADGDLQARVRESDDERQPTAGQGGDKHEHTVNRQQPTGRNHVPVIFNLAREGERESDIGE